MPTHDHNRGDGEEDRDAIDGVDARFVCRSSALRRIAWLERELDRPDVQAVPELAAAYRAEQERLQRIPLEAAAFSAVWRDIAASCERGLAEPTYPDDRR